MHFSIRILIATLFTSVIPFGVAAGLAYCDGCWNNGFQPEDAIIIGLIAAIVGAGWALTVLRRGGALSKIQSWFVVVGLLMAYFLAAQSLLMRLYVSGVECAVFRVASVQQWGMVKNCSSNSVCGSEQRRKAMPHFVQNVYPFCYTYVSVFTNAVLHKNYVLVWWRGAGYNPGVQIGVGGLEPPSVFFTRRYSNDVSIIFFGGHH